MADTLLCRYASSIFWLARYVERAENLARILDINASFTRDQLGGQDWLPVLKLNADQERFATTHPVLAAEAVLRFYVIEQENPGSIISVIAMARENARLLRPLISNEMWAQLNIFNKWLRALDDQALTRGQLPRLFSRIREACQTHAGIADGTLHRDQGFYFYGLGRYIERADQTTRLLDVKYHTLLPSTAEVGTPIDVGQWDALLRSAAAHYAYLRAESVGVTPSGVAGFLLLHPRFPRSVAFSVGEADRSLEDLRFRHDLRGGADAAKSLGGLRSDLTTLSIQGIIECGLHEFLEQVQRRLVAATNDLDDAFFGSRPSAIQAQH